MQQDQICSWFKQRADLRQQRKQFQELQEPSWQFQTELRCSGTGGRLNDDVCNGPLYMALDLSECPFHGQALATLQTLRAGIMPDIDQFLGNLPGSVAQLQPVCPWAWTGYLRSVLNKQGEVLRVLKIECRHTL